VAARCHGAYQMSLMVVMPARSMSAQPTSASIAHSSSPMSFSMRKATSKSAERAARSSVWLRKTIDAAWLWQLTKPGSTALPRPPSLRAGFHVPGGIAGPAWTIRSPDIATSPPWMIGLPSLTG